MVQHAWGPDLARRDDNELWADTISSARVIASRWASTIVYCKRRSSWWPCVWRIVTEWSLKPHGQGSKQSPNLPISWIIHELKCIMVNKGQIHREFGKFLMISSNWSNWMMNRWLKLEKWNFMEEDLKKNPLNQKSMNLTLILRRNWRLNRGKFLKMKNNEIQKLRLKLLKITILNWN